MTAPNPQSPQHLPRLPPHLLKLVAAAFGIGILLFFLVWLSSRHTYDFYKADGSDAAATTSDNTLPAPLPPDIASGNNASGLRIDKTPQPGNQPPPISLPRATEPAIKAAPASAAPTNTASTHQATPTPVSTPAPRYPQEALRLGIGGTVKVRVSVASDGSIAQLELAESSGNRYLDRAALDAVRRWTFQAATRNGQPVSADAVVPIVFNPAG